jgi:iron complex transport system substrate-binding protein
MAVWLLAVLSMSLSSAVACDQGDCGEMKRRPQGILTGMPFMAHVSSRSFVDDAGRNLYFAKPPARIISLAPSVTEMVFAIGAGDQLVGVTDFCDFPPQAATKPKIGYANPNLESILALQPDLVLAPKEFLRPDVVAALDQLKVPVFVMAATTVEDILAHLGTLGRMLGRPVEANNLTMDLRRQLAEIKSRMERVPPVRVLYVLNSQPLITVGPGSFIDQLITLAGGVNVAAKSGTPYPHLSMETVLMEDPEALVFPVGQAEGISEGEQQMWRQWTGMTAVKRERLHQIPASVLNRPGPRIIQALRMLVDIVHPELTPAQPMNR